MKKAVIMFVFVLLCSSIFAVAQETSDIYDEETVVKECNLGCKIWQFLFGSQEARAGKAWFDRSEALVGQAGKQDFSVTYVEKAGDVPKSVIVPAETEQDARNAVENEIFFKQLNSCTACQITSVTKKGEKSAPAAKPAAGTSAPAAPKPAASAPPSGVSPSDHSKAVALHKEAGELIKAGKFPEALEKENQVLTIEPSSYKAHGRKADIFEKMGKYNEAAQSYQKALQDPTIPDDVKKTTQENQVNAVSKYLKQPDANTQLKSEGVKGTLEGKEGTFTLDNSGKILSFQPIGGEKKEVHDLSKTQFGSSSSADSSKGKSVINPDTESKLKSILSTSTYDQYKKNLKAKEVFTRSDGTLVMRGIGGIITVAATDNEGKPFGQGIQIGQRSDGNGKVLESYLIKDGQILATQDDKGNIKVGEVSYKSPKDQNIASSDSLGDLKDGLQLPGKEGSFGFMQLDGDVFTAVNYEQETMQRTNTKTKESEQLKVDYYKDGESECKTDGGCWVPTGGTATISDAHGNPQPYLVDYDYKTITGADRADSKNLEDKEYFNPQTGRQEGTTLPDETGIFAERKYSDDGKKQVGYTGNFEVTDADGNKGLITKDEKGDWAAVSDDKVQSAVELAVAQDWLTSEQNKKLADDRYSSTQGGLADAQTALESIYKITNNIKSYPAISNLLFGKADFYKKWRSDMDKAFAPLLGSNWVPSAICENDALHWQDIEPEGKAVIKTTSGTYQAVASIQLERSPETSPILCHKNPDEESKELFICDSRQVCVDDSFCYADQDRDHEPDSKEPLKGYFYKVTWAVSSPQDEAFTPLVDENGVAVSFNIFLYPGAVPMYNLNGNIASPIQLQNGARDKDSIIKYSTNQYDSACIKWNQAPISIGVAGRDGAAAGFGKIEDVCFNVVTSTVGQVNWERSGQGSTSISQNSGSISKNTDW